MIALPCNHLCTQGSAFVRTGWARCFTHVLVLSMCVAAKQRLIRSSLSFGDRKVKAQANFQKLTPEEKIVLKARAVQEINMERRQAKRPRLPGADVSASGFGADSLAAGPVDVDGPLRGDRAHEALKIYFNRNVSE